MSRRKPRSGRRSNHERWLVSYADFITLLFAFFVVLYASSQVDKRKVGKLAMAIQVAFQEMGVFQASTTEVPIDLASPMPFSTAQAIENSERTASLGQIASHPQGAPGTSVENGDLAQLQKDLEAALTVEIGRKEIAMRREPDGLIISLREVGFFESGSAQMKPTSQGAFDRIADILRQRDYRLRIEGHTDNAPIHTSQFPSNWELSSSRATEMVRLLNYPRWIPSRSSVRWRIRRVSSGGHQSHRRRPPRRPPRRYRNPRPHPDRGLHGPSWTRSPDAGHHRACEPTR